METLAKMPTTPVSDFLWHELLTEVRSTFGRLVHLASLRNPNSGRYTHGGVADRFGLQEADRVLRAAHDHVFKGWLNYTLEQQSADLDLYLCSLPDDRLTLLRLWAHLKLYHTFIPESASNLECQVYICDLEAIVTMLRHACELTTEKRSHSDVSTGIPDSRIARALQWISNHYREPRLSRQSISETLGISNDYFGRLFKQQTGLSFRQYVLNLRMLKASELLRTSNHSVKQVASDVGYEDQSHFGQDFRLTFGTSPAKYRAPFCTVHTEDES